MHSQRTRPSAAPIAVGFLLVENFSLLSYAMAIEPLRAANTLSGGRCYSWVHVSVDGNPARASNGVLVSCDGKVGDMPAISRLYVCAGGNPATFTHAPTFRWLRQLSRKGVALCGISGGPYLLARARLLDGYRFTIHWEHGPALAEDFPHLEPTPGLYVIDRDRSTSAGGLAVLDMMHEVIAADYGAALAGDVSRWFLQTELRSPERPQRLSIAGGIALPKGRLTTVLADISERIEEPLSRGELATRAGVSIRQLDRYFRAELGMSARAYYMAARLERADILLRQTAITIVDIAVACGFKSASHFSRAYRRHFGHAPRSVRKG